MKTKTFTRILFGVVMLLLIPLIAMQFTNEVNWTIMDFVVVGTLLTGTAMLCELVWRKVKTTKYRILICGAIIFTLLLIWAELAVGLFGTPFAGS